jgi:hypothetical protein
VLWRGYVVTQVQTLKHKFWVAFYLLRFLAANRHEAPTRLLWRAVVHDLSKFRWVEAGGFAKTIFKLRDSTYGSAEYFALTQSIAPSIRHHYEVNSHHPEYWGIGDYSDFDRAGKLGYERMPEIDKMEMLCDWAAACRRHANGDLGSSIFKNARRFGYGIGEAKQLQAWGEQIGVIHAE